ncbi:hypothetical protein HZH66_010773 [Vespula vulgaris]|uniref:Uncharacterized protein n=1 Tax=Vespula vulgaris TaxID=7454 RepID=A0A834JMC5_VESVU|nr:hypothetical protein HZH66_010773 [Vespula vulgaris]
MSRSSEYVFRPVASNIDALVDINNHVFMIFFFNATNIFDWKTKRKRLKRFNFIMKMIYTKIVDDLNVRTATLDEDNYSFLATQYRAKVSDPSARAGRNVALRQMDLKGNCREIKDNSSRRRCPSSRFKTILSMDQPPHL